MESVLRSTPTKTSYSGLMECAAKGLHAFVFNRFKKHLRERANILDLGSGDGAFAKRLTDAGYNVTACDIEPRAGRPFPYVPVNLNSEFSEAFHGKTYDAISFVEVIEHLENPRLCFREIAKLVKPNGVVLLTTPNASGLYSRLRFFFTGQMAMFTDVAYSVGPGHITPLTVWQLEKVFMETGFSVLERTFHDAPFFPPKALGDVAKVFAWIVCRPFMFGVVGGQNVIYVLRRS
jgi:SAM-dependent methyltransferase